MLQSMGLQRVGHDLASEHHHHQQNELEVRGQPQQQESLATPRSSPQFLEAACSSGHMGLLLTSSSQQKDLQRVSASK